MMACKTFAPEGLLGRPGSLLLLIAALAAGCGDTAEDDAADDSGSESGDGAVVGGADGSGVARLFFLDITGNRVLSIDPDGSNEHVLLSRAGTLPDGIALDVARGHIYWTNMGAPASEDGSIKRCDFDGGNVEVIVESGGTYTPKQLKLEPQEGKLYWSDREGMRVMRANLDGSELETLVTLGEGDGDRGDLANHAVGMAVDLAGGMVYWSQKGPDNGMVGSIRRAPILLAEGEAHDTRTDVEILFDKLPEPIDLDLDVEAGMLYWTDRGDDTVNRAPMEPSGEDADARTDREILVTGVSEAIGLSLDLWDRRMYYTELSTGKIGSARMDGSDAHVIADTTGGLTGIVHTRVPD